MQSWTARAWEGRAWEQKQECEAPSLPHRGLYYHAGSVSVWLWTKHITVPPIAKALRLVHIWLSGMPISNCISWPVFLTAISSYIFGEFSSGFLSLSPPAEQRGLNFQRGAQIDQKTETNSKTWWMKNKPSRAPEPGDTRGSEKDECLSSSTGVFSTQWWEDKTTFATEITQVIH